MRTTLSFLMGPIFFIFACQPSQGSDAFEPDDVHTDGETEQSDVADESEEDEALDDDTEPTDESMGVLSSGIYYLNTTEEDWSTDTCGVAEHESVDIPLEVYVYDDGFIIGDLWSTDEDGIDDVGQFSMVDGLYTTDDYGEDCTVTFTITEGMGQVVGDDHFEVYFTTTRTGEGDCAAALEEIEQLPCEETRTWHLTK